MEVQRVCRSQVLVGFAVVALAAAASVSDVGAFAVGHTPGEGYVSSTGEAGYRIPLRLPPGIKGVEPALALTYGHHGGDGLLGVGWSLEGLSAIHRCNRSLAQDGALAPVDLSATDRLCLDGQRLRRTSGTYGLSGSTYQTELEIFSRVTANGTGGSAPAWFKVEGRDGLTYFYGNTADSRIEGTGSTAIREWALNRVEDRAGNYLTVTYAKDAANGTYRPTEIRYTGTNGGAPAYGVHFQYEDRPNGDRPGGYFAGGIVLETKRLTRIEARFGSTVVRRYNFDYAVPGPTGRSRLESIQECGLSAAECLPATQLDWAGSTAGWGAEAVAIAIDNAGNALPGDLDGDGFEDLAWFDSGSNTWKVLRGSASGYLASSVDTGFGSALHYQQALAGDLDGSGRQGILVPHTNEVWHWLRYTGSGYAAASTGVVNTAGAGNTILVDIDGDGRDDLVYASGLKIYWRRNTTSAGTPSFASAAELWSFPPWHAAQPNPLGAAQDQFRSMVRVGDFNGDGRADLLLYTRYELCQGEPACPPAWQYELRALISTGTALVEQLLWMGMAPLLSPPLLGDFNGDGLTDILHAEGSPATWRIRFATGARTPGVGGFTAALNTGIDASGHVVAVVTDFDGDGRTDVVAPIGGNLHVCRSDGETLAPCTPTGIAAGSWWKVTDIDGDGLPDLAYANGGTWRYRLHGTGLPDVLQSITDGLGNQVSFTLEALPRTAAYTKGSGAVFPERDFAAPLHVVTELQASDGIGGNYSLTYQYETARLHLQGRGFLGFAARRVEDSRTGFQTLETYRQDYPYIGALDSQVTWQANGTTKIAELANTWQTKSYASGYDARRFPFISESLQTSYELGGPFNGMAVTTVTTTTTYDDWGNPTDTLVSTAAAGTGESFTTRTQVPNPGVNMLNDTHYGVWAGPGGPKSQPRGPARLPWYARSRQSMTRSSAASPYRPSNPT